MTFKKTLLYVSFAAILLVAGGLIVFSLLRPSNQPSETRSPYVSQLDSPVRGLSAQEVDDLLNGRGAGYARSAELNSYPGPRHVLDMRSELDLGPDIEAQIETVFAQMEAEAQRLGHEIVRQEAQLSQGFAEDALSETEMRAEVQALAKLYGELRATHLQAHFQIKSLLTPEQVAAYDHLRGYDSQEAAPMQHDSMQHN